MNIVIGHLYGDSMNIYGDRGNTLALKQRCVWRGIDAEIVNFGYGAPLDPDTVDILFIGGGQDLEQHRVATDLQAVKGDAVRAAVAADMPLLSICGGYQLLGHYFKPISGETLPGISVFDAHTVGGNRRLIGNVVVEIDTGVLPDGEPTTLVGFENHSGQTFLGPTAKPLGRTIVGGGNNGQDGYEGARHRNAFGCYLHGSLLPKNPHFADHLIRLAIQRRYGAATPLPPLERELEMQAHHAVIARAKQLRGLRSGIR